MIPCSDVLQTVLGVNGLGKAFLDPKDFDAIVFMAARIKTEELFPPLLHLLQPTYGGVSKAVILHTCIDWLSGLRFYQDAKAMAASGNARIFLAPTPFVSEGSEDLFVNKYPNALKAEKKHRQEIWNGLAQVVAGDGITLISQPEETVINGCMTRKEFSGVTADGGINWAHRNARYAALLFKALFQNGG